MNTPIKGGYVAETVTLNPKDEIHDGAQSVPLASEFKQKSIRGGMLTVFGQGYGMLLQITSTVILAHLLSPFDYGLQSMVFTLTTFFTLFRDAGLSGASVQREKLAQDQISTLFWINVALGAVLTLAVAAAAPFLAAFYREPRLLWITLASSSIFFFNGLIVQHRALLERAMRFGTGVKIDAITGTIGVAIAIVMAARGFGYWALICQNIALPIIGTAAIWTAMPWAPGRPRWTPELREMLRFGGTITFNGVIVYIAYNTEKVLLGRYWGAAPLGIYTRGYQLATLPVQQLIGAVHVVAFSVLSRMQSDAERLERAFLKSLSVIVAITIPVVISSAMFANEIVLIVLGRKWLPVVPVLQLLAPTVLFFALINPFSWFLRATGRVRRSLNTAFLICPVVILGVVAGLHYGPTGVALGYSAAMITLFVPIVAWAKHGTGITTHDYWNSVKQPLVSGILAGAVGWLVHVSCGDSFAPIPLLALELGAAATSYVACLLIVMGQKEFYFDLARQIIRPGQGRPSEI
jgi:O-antigen/teichoic acid export membrane protein